jgi:DNA-binding LytR/AlgR family response regulator
VQAFLPGRFQQIHRSTVANMDEVAATTRDDTGRLSLSLRNRPERLPVSHIYADLFRQMSSAPAPRISLGNSGAMQGDA